MYKSPNNHVFMHPKLHFGNTQTDQSNPFSNQQQENAKPQIKRKILTVYNLAGFSSCQFLPGFFALQKAIRFQFTQETLKI